MGTTIAIMKEIWKCASTEQASSKPFLIWKPIKNLAWSLEVSTMLGCYKAGYLLSRNNEWTGDKGLMNYSKLCLFTNVPFPQMAFNSNGVQQKNSSTHKVLLSQTLVSYLYRSIFLLQRHFPKLNLQASFKERTKTTQLSCTVKLLIEKP